MDREPTDPPPDEPPYEAFPDARPLRRIQAATAGLIAVAAVVTLLSGSRPAEVRWLTLIGLVLLIVAIIVITRRRRSGG